MWTCREEAIEIPAQVAFTMRVTSPVDCPPGTGALGSSNGPLACLV
jgi:hypothetical protein